MDQQTAALQLLCRAWERMGAGTHAHASAYLALDRPLSRNPSDVSDAFLAWVALLAASAPVLTPAGLGRAAHNLWTATHHQELRAIELAIAAMKHDPQTAQVTPSCMTVAARWASNFARRADDEIRKNTE